MSPVVFVADEQETHPVDAKRWMDLAEKVLKAEKVGDEMEVSVMYVDEASIAELNERFMGKEGPTDVLSFPIDEAPPEPGRMPDSGGSGPGANSAEDEEVVALLGDVIICPAVAERNAPDHAGTYEDELALLLVHGLLHLLGMDHLEEAEALIMERRERELLAEFHGTLPESAWPAQEYEDQQEDSEDSEQGPEHSEQEEA